ncbi:MAG: AmmeMemoRadiSam system radical SAM enzyme [Victivallaceae bacterium]
MAENYYIHPASWWEPCAGNKVKCRLCPRNCVIGEGHAGYCGVRENRGGKLFSISYGRPVAVHVDPIEKKPLARFMPRTSTFSFGTFGCNLGCLFCQNDSLSRGAYEFPGNYEFVKPEQIVELAQRTKSDSISFTYNEPTVFAEYAIDIAKLAKAAGLPRVLVSNGYITREAAEDFYPLIDAANIDMKGFSEEFYREMTYSTLQPVLDSIKYLYSLGKHIEITTLVIPGKNDSMEMLNAWLDWVEQNLDKTVPLHFSAYHPCYKYTAPPTPRETLLAIRRQALSRGFEQVFLGNI